MNWLNNAVFFWRNEGQLTKKYEEQEEEEEVEEEQEAQERQLYHLEMVVCLEAFHANFSQM